MNKLKKIISVMMMITMAASALTGCSSGTSSSSESDTASGNSSNTNSSVSLLSSETTSDYFDDEDLLDSYDSVTAEISLNGDNVEISGKGVEYSDKTISVVTGGTFVFTGELNDGQIYINNEELTHIIFNGVNISNTSSSPVFVENADKVVITCVSGTENVLSDSENYVYESDEENEPDAVIFSKDDLSLNGSGSLTINANYNEGITCKDDLRISGSIINVTSVGNGIKGKDSVVIKDSEITVNAQEDGIKSSNADEEDKGYIVFESGNYNITAIADAVQSENTLTVNDGNFIITSGSESSQSTDTTETGSIFGNRFGDMEGNPNSTENSEKGLKAVSDININGGTFDINSTDDCIHSNGNVIINNGDLTINSGDDGIHSDENVDIKDGNVNIESSYEGIEGIIINIDGGSISVTASDDGFNASDGSGSDMMMGGFNSSSSSCELNINDGSVYVNAAGDGLDSNGILNINGGIIVVDGPTSDGDGALDSGSEIVVNGGILVAAGSSGMAEVPSSSSSQNSIVATFSQTNDSSTPICLKDSVGNVIISYQPSKQYSSVVISTPELISGNEYSVYYGGSISSSSQGNAVIDGDYSGGELLETVTLSDTITYVGDGSVGQMGGGAMGGGAMGGRDGFKTGDDNSDFDIEDGDIKGGFGRGGNGDMGNMTLPDNSNLNGDFDPLNGETPTFGNMQ